MRIKDANDSYYSVQVSRLEVESFRNSWPCSRLPDRAITFRFSRRNGDLVDITDGVDGEDAVALSHDAQAYGRNIGLEGTR